MSNELIQCRDHKWAPWSIVCVHLVANQSKKWMPIPSESAEVDYDWMCPACAALDEPDLDDLKAICIHCVRDLRRRFDVNYD